MLSLRLPGLHFGPCKLHLICACETCYRKFRKSFTFCNKLSSVANTMWVQSIMQGMANMETRRPAPQMDMSSIVGIFARHLDQCAMEMAQRSQTPVLFWVHPLQLCHHLLVLVRILQRRLQCR